MGGAATPNQGVRESARQESTLDLKHTQGDMGWFGPMRSLCWGKSTCPLYPGRLTGKKPHQVGQLLSLPPGIRVLTHVILSYLRPRKPQELQETSEFQSKMSLRRVCPSRSAPSSMLTRAGGFSFSLCFSEVLLRAPRG